MGLEETNVCNIRQHLYYRHQHSASRQEKQMSVGKIRMLDGLVSTHCTKCPHV
jgi:hypothetical protein